MYLHKITFFGGNSNYPVNFAIQKNSSAKLWIHNFEFSENWIFGPQFEILWQCEVMDSESCFLSFLFGISASKARMRPRGEVATSAKASFPRQIPRCSPIYCSSTCCFFIGYRKCTLPYVNNFLNVSWNQFSTQISERSEHPIFTVILL